MTITINPVRNEFTATAAQAIFTYTFKIFADTDLNVYQTPAGQDCLDSDLITAYTVTGVGDEDGGTITLNTPATLGDLITIVSNIPESRTTDYQTNGDFIPQTVNDDFDRVVSLAKQTEDTANRGLQFEQCEQNVSGLSLPQPVAGKFLKWKGDLSGLENVGVAPEISILTNQQVGNNALAPHESLVCSNPSVSTVDIDANAVLVRDSSNTTTRLDNINLTLDITASGINGLDTGSEATDTWYHYYVIFNPTTVVTQGLFSVSATSPTLPAGFTFFGLVGAVFNNSGSDFNDLIQIGNLVTIPEDQVLPSSTSTSVTLLDLSDTIPVTAIEAIVNLEIRNSVANASSNGFLFATNAMTFQVAHIQNFGGPSPNDETDYTTSIIIHEAQTTYHRVINIQTTLTISVHGWKF